MLLTHRFRKSLLSLQIFRVFEHRRQDPGAQQILSQFYLSEQGGSFAAQLSGGLQQRVQIARAIAHRPAVLFLDEPGAGLDPQSRIAYFIPAVPVKPEVDNWPLLILVLVLSSLVASALGLAIG